MLNLLVCCDRIGTLGDWPTDHDAVTAELAGLGRGDNPLLVIMDLQRLPDAGVMQRKSGRVT